MLKQNAGRRRPGRLQARSAGRTRRSGVRICALEQLESRQLLSATPLSAGTAHPLNVLATSAAGTALVAGYSPAQMRHAYGFDQLALNGAGQTIAIVDAFNDPNIRHDLTVFDQRFGLPAPPGFKQVNQTGGAALPKTNGGWAQEISIDVQWAHAIAPGASILLVEAKSDGIQDLMAAVDQARKQPGVSVVSMSWGGGEFQGELKFASHFTAPANHQGVTFVASTGDSAASSSWPAVSPNVLSVGGTHLNLDASGNRLSETAWRDGGGGISRYEPAPAYQSGVQNTSYRTVPDVAYDADPNTGVAVYDSLAYQGAQGWLAFGGTSVGAPQWAGLIALANQGRANATLPTLANLPADLYQAVPPSHFYDIVKGSNGYSAHAGYDYATGLGTPRANLIAADLVALSSEPAVSNAAPLSSQAPADVVDKAELRPQGGSDAT
ncbi:MAG: S53 family peptidase [Thermoguttaceae bacterium]